MKLPLARLLVLTVSFAALGAAHLRAAVESTHDVVVYGGTSGGVTAAVAAARQGRAVVLIEPGRHLGGLTSGGLGATDIGKKRPSAGSRASSTSV